MRSELRPHQAAAINQLKHSILAGNRRIVLQAPTGAGKTVIGAAITDGARAKGNRVIFTVPAISLINQTVERFWAEGITEIGVIQADHEMTNPGMPVQIASIQSLSNREVPLADVVIIDECHRWFEFYGDWMSRPEWAAVPFIGLSATPWTKGLGNHFRDLQVVATIEQLIEQGYLSRFEVFAPSHPDLSGVRTVAGDYHEGELSAVMGDSKLMADVVETWMKHGTGSKTLCFAVDRAHARKIQAQFHAAGVTAGYIDAHTSLNERKQIEADFHSETVPVVVNIGTLTTGVDWDVRCLILARPTKSKMLFTQIIGRALRTAAGKDTARILDHSDTHLRLGMVTDIHIDRLDDGAKGGAAASRNAPEKLPTECPECSFVKPAGVHKCPHCGFAPQRQSAVEAGDGQLAKISKGAAKQPTPQEKEMFYRGLLGYAELNGKSQGWVLALFKNKFDHWPAKKRGLEPINPSAEVLGWIKHSQIKWAAKQKRRAAA